MGAWKIQNRWNGEALACYRNFVEHQAPRYVNQRFTCEDFALRLLVDFTAAHGLPVAIYGGALLDARDEQFKGKEEFVAALSRQTAAWHLRSPENTKLRRHSLMVAEPGDLLLHVRYHSSDWFHTQVVVRRIGRTLEVFQGNLGLGWQLRISALSPFDPRSPIYRGVRPEFAVYEIDASGNPLSYESRHGIRERQEVVAMWDRSEVRIWNTDCWR